MNPLPTVQDFPSEPAVCNVLCIGCRYECLHVPLMNAISSVELQLHRPDGELDGAEPDDV